MKTSCRVKDMWKRLIVPLAMFAMVLPSWAVPFNVTFLYPTNGTSFGAPANVYLHAGVSDSNLVQFVLYYTGNTLVGSVSNRTGVILTNTTQVNPFYMTWSNVPAGNYPLTAVAIDSAGNTTTSAPANITVT